MTVLVAAQALVTALLALLVIGLLRSHAEILRRLHELGAGLDGAPSPARAPASLAPPSGARGADGHDVRGQSPQGEQAIVAVVGVRANTLLAFLSTGCATCGGFWEAFARADGLGLPPGTRVVVLTRGPDTESVSALRRHDLPSIPVVMSSEAWEEYGVPGSPYFVLVEGESGRVVGEGAAQRWEDVRSLMTQAIEDAAEAAGSPRPRGGRDRPARVDAELLAAGIGPGHASLHPDPDEDRTTP